MTNLDPHLAGRRERQESTPFFSCLQCYPDQGEIEVKSLSSTHSRKDFQRISIQQGPTTMRTSQQVYLNSYDLMDSRRSQLPRTDKISIKGRRSTLQPHAVQLAQHELPSFLPRQPIRTSFNHEISVDKRPQHSQRELPGRYSRHSIAFSYREGPPQQFSLSEQAQQNRPPQLQRRVLQPQPQESVRSLNSPRQQVDSPIKSKTSLSSPLKNVAPHLALLDPKIVVSRDIDENKQPAPESNFIRCLPQQPMQTIHLEFTDKKLSDLYKEKEGEMYDSLEPVPKLVSKKSSKKNKGFSSNAFKVRQTVSIKEPEEDEGEVHESIVIERTKYQDNMLAGLLNPISESDEYGCTMGTTLFQPMKKI